MLPTLLKLGPITISSLGVFTALGFFFGSFLIWKRGKEENYDEERLMDAVLLSAIGVLVTSRIWYILLHWQEFGSNIVGWFDVVGAPGLSWFGALMGGLLVLKIFSSRQKWNFFKIADFFSFGACLSAIFIAFGLFLDGSAYGAPTSLPWGIAFPGLDQPRHPVQLYIFFLFILIFKLLYYFDKNYRTYQWYKNKRGEAAPGFLLLAFLALFSLGRFGVGFFFEHDLYWMVNQIMALGLSLGSLLVLFLRSGKTVSLNLPTFKRKQLQEDYRRERKNKKFHYKSGVDVK